MSTDVILVDENDQEIGLMEKNSAHELGLLHRAFRFSSSTTKMNYYFNSGQQLNTTPQANGQIPAAAIHIRMKRLMKQQVAD